MNLIGISTRRLTSFVSAPLLSSRDSPFARRHPDCLASARARHYAPAAAPVRRQCKFSPTGTIILISRSRNFAPPGINIPARARGVNMRLSSSVYVSENLFQGRSLETQLDVSSLSRERKRENTRTCTFLSFIARKSIIDIYIFTIRPAISGKRNQKNTEPEDEENLTPAVVKDTAGSQKGKI